MPYIYPLQGQKHTDLTRELSALGGTQQETFRLAFAWDGEHFFEVTENDTGLQLYEQWIASHGGDGSPEPEANGGPSDSASGDVTEHKSTPDPDETPSQDGQASADETPAAPVALDAPPLPDPPERPVPATISEIADADSEEARKPDPSTSGTNRKRSAKNSNRRS